MVTFLAHRNLARPKLASALEKGKSNVVIIEKVMNETGLEYDKSYEAQGRYIVMNGVTYFNQISHDMNLCDNNYHLMVSLLKKLLENRISLRVEAPEWYPTTEEIGNRESENSESVKEDNECKLMKPKKVIRTMDCDKRKKAKPSSN